MLKKVLTQSLVHKVTHFALTLRRFGKSNCDLTAQLRNGNRKLNVCITKKTKLEKKKKKKTERGKEEGLEMAQH